MVAEEDKVVAEEDKVVAEEDKVVADEDEGVADEDEGVADKDQRAAVASNACVSMPPISITHPSYKKFIFRLLFRPQ